MLNTHVLKCFHTSAVSSTSTTTGVLHYCILAKRLTRFHSFCTVVDLEQKKLVISTPFGGSGYGSNEALR
jgi:hypothetical protein